MMGQLVAAVDRLARLLEKYEKHPPTTGDVERPRALTPAEKQAAYRYRKSENTVTNMVTNTVTNAVTNAVTPVTHSPAAVSSYNTDISRDNLSPSKGERDCLTTVTREQSGNKHGNKPGNKVGNKVGNGNAVTEPPLNIDPLGTDRDWRAMIRGPRQ